MTIRAVITAALLVLAVFGLILAIGYIWIALVAVFLGSFAVEHLYGVADRQAYMWANDYSDGVVEHLSKELAKVQPGDEAKLREVLRRHIHDAILNAAHL